MYYIYFCFPGNGMMSAGRLISVYTSPSSGGTMVPSGIRQCASFIVCAGTGCHVPFPAVFTIVANISFRRENKTLRIKKLHVFFAEKFLSVRKVFFIGMIVPFFLKAAYRFLSFSIIILKSIGIGENLNSGFSFSSISIVGT